MKTVNFKNFVISFMLFMCMAHVGYSQSDVSAESQNVVAFQDGKKWGLKDLSGNVVMPATYDKIEEFKEGLAAVNKGGKMKQQQEFLLTIDVFAGGKWGFIDMDGKEIVPCKYDKVEGFSGGVAAVNIGGKFKKEYILGSSRERFTGGKWGLIGVNGNELASCKYDNVEKFSEGLACVKWKGKFGYLDKNGKEVIPLKYNDAKSFSYGRALVQVKNKYGFINASEVEVIPCKYDIAESFTEGLAAVNIGASSQQITMPSGMGGDTYNVLAGGKWGFIDVDGNIVIPFTYEHAKPFKNGKSEILLDKQSHIINTKGEIISH